MNFKPPSIEKRKVEFINCFKQILRPRDQSDRTSLTRIADWLAEQCEAGKFDETAVFGQVLTWAQEVVTEKKAKMIRNPWAVLMSILKKELGYKKNG